MTTEEKFTKMLTDNGMFDSQAASVMEQFKEKAKELGGDYNITWERPASEYPDPLYAVLKPLLFKCAVEWINENVPLAWFKPMFER